VTVKFIYYILDEVRSNMEGYARLLSVCKSNTRFEHSAHNIHWYSQNISFESRPDTFCHNSSFHDVSLFL
jgi:hypothetical protein